MTSVTTVRMDCAGGCGRLAGLDERTCPDCKEIERLLAVRRDLIAQRNKSFGVGTVDPCRLEVESLSAPETGNPDRRSALMAELPRVDAGVEESLDDWGAAHELCDDAAIELGAKEFAVGYAAMLALFCLVCAGIWTLFKGVLWVVFHVAFLVKAAIH